MQQNWIRRKNMKRKAAASSVADTEDQSLSCPVRKSRKTAWHHYLKEFGQCQGIDVTVMVV